MSLLLAGCGGGEDEPAPRTVAERTPPQHRPSDADVRARHGLPDRVPLRATGAAEFGDADVVRRWMDELRRGEIARAAARFRRGALFANFGPPLVLGDASEALGATASLPCGARLRSVRGAGAYVLYEAELTERPGGDCGTGVGGRVAGAILVVDGEIAEWWRLPDRPRPPAGSIV